MIYIPGISPTAGPHIFGQDMPPMPPARQAAIGNPFGDFGHQDLIRMFRFNNSFIEEFQILVRVLSGLRLRMTALEAGETMADLEAVENLAQFGTYDIKELTDWPDALVEEWVLIVDAIIEANERIKALESP